MTEPEGAANPGAESAHITCRGTRSAVIPPRECGVCAEQHSIRAKVWPIVPYVTIGSRGYYPPITARLNGAIEHRSEQARLLGVRIRIVLTVAFCALAPAERRSHKERPVMLGWAKRAQRGQVLR